MNVISQQVGATLEFNTIAKVCKYKRLHERHHFILMVMEVHGKPRCDMECFIRERLFFSMINDREVICFCLFAFEFFKQHVNIVLQHVLAFAIEMNIALVGDTCSRPPITVRSHDLHVSDIIGVMGEITSYHKRGLTLSPFWFLWAMCLLAFLWPSILSFM